MTQHPDSVGGRRCFNLIQQIEARSSRVRVERVWNQPQPTIDVFYRNVDEIHFRLVPFNFDRFAAGQKWSPDSLSLHERKSLLGRQPVKAWSVDLPATEDYRERLERIPAPGDVPAGSYFLIASHQPRFLENNNQVSFSEVWVSDLALVTRNVYGGGLIEGFVLDARSGDPIAGAEVKAWLSGSRADKKILAANVRTDANGLVRFRAPNHQRLLLLASHGEQRLSSTHHLSAYRDDSKPQVKQQTIFFTDRSLYRPGQTVRYKGICVSVDHERDVYETVANRTITVVFLDVNGKEIERVEHRTNDYGSFSGSVTAPRDRLRGRMTLRVFGDPQSQTQISVEEYKRPKFQVELQPPTEATKLGGSVRVKGKAAAYTGAAIGDAKVSWRVVRNVSYPRWWHWRCWWMPARPAAPQEIAHGTTQTTPGGEFEIDFQASPDPSVAESSEPTFRFTVYADVTDGSGETRSDQFAVRVGFTAMTATLAADDWQTSDAPIKLNVHTATLDGKGLSSRGTVKIHSLQQPDTVARVPLGPPFRSADPEAAGEPQPHNPNSWPEDELIIESNFETDGAGRAAIMAELSPGLYRATLETQDRFGKRVTAILPIQVLDPNARRLAIKVPHLFAAPRASVEPGEDFVAVWGSGYDTARAFVEIEHRGKVIESYWTDADVTQHKITRPVTESMRGGFTVRTTMIRENRAYFESRRVNVPWSNKQLALKWEHFVSKLKPAQKETWTAVVSGPDAEASVAEMVATLYDASLDAYQRHHWQRGFQVFRTDYARVGVQFENSLRNLQVIFHGWSIPSRDGTLEYRHFPIGSQQICSVTTSGAFGKKH